MLLAQISPLEFRMVIPRSPVTVPESEIDSELDGLLSAGSASEDTDSSNERYCMSLWLTEILLIANSNRIS